MLGFYGGVLGIGWIIADALLQPVACAAVLSAAVLSNRDRRLATFFVGVSSVLVIAIALSIRDIGSAQISIEVANEISQDVPEYVVTALGGLLLGVPLYVIVRGVPARIDQLLSANESTE